MIDLATDRAAPPATAVRAEARVVAAVVHGRNRCTTLRSAPPLTFRRTGDDISLVGTMAGPVGGDELRLAIEVDEGAELSIRSIAANLVLPGPAGAPSQWSTDVALGREASLCWRPEPTVLVAGCDHRTRLRFDVVGGSSLWWREELVLGRHREPGGSLQQRMDLVVDGRPVHRSEIQLGPRWPGSMSPATNGAARCVGTILAVGRDTAAVVGPTEHPDLAVHDLSHGAVLINAVGPNPAQVRRLLDDVRPDRRR